MPQNNRVAALPLLFSLSPLFLSDINIVSSLSLAILLSVAILLFFIYKNKIYPRLKEDVKDKVALIGLILSLNCSIIVLWFWLGSFISGNYRVTLWFNKFGEGGIEGIIFLLSVLFSLFSIHHFINNKRLNI